VVSVLDSGADGPGFKSQTVQTVVIVNMVRMVRKYCDVSAAIKLNFHMLSTTRGIAKNASRYNLRKFSFCSRVVNIWNSLPDSVVDAYTINTF